MSRDEMDELLGALAFDALDADERDEALAVVERDPSARAALAEMQSIVARMGEHGAVAPPPGLRDSILGTITAVTPATVVAPAHPAAVYRSMVETMLDRLSRLDEQQWTRIARPYEWSVQGLIGHLTSIERYTASKLGLADFEYPEDRETDHLGLGEHVIAEELTHPPAETFGAWRDASELILSHVDELDGTQLEEEVAFHGFPVKISTLLVLRSFEIWTHIDDVARANGLPLSELGPADLRTMSTTSVRLARWVMNATGAAPDTGLVRVVLTGDGGGVMPLRFGNADTHTPDVTVIADVIDYCRMAAQRLAPEDLAADVDGDRDLAMAFMHAAASIAV